MILIVGLGNPGKKYQKTRHNLGFRVIDEFQRENHFPKFEFQKELSSLISEGKLNNKKIILAKPQTFMNFSGKGAKLLLAFYKTPFANLWVVHDDLDLSLGKIRISVGRGSAGHKGVQSIINELKTPSGQAKNFVRFRIGTQPKTGKPKNVENFVLQKFKKDEEKILKEAIKKTIEAIEFAIKYGLEKAMNSYNK